MILGLAGLGGRGRFLDQFMSGIPGNNNSATPTPIQIPTDTPPANSTPTVPVSANCLSSPMTENFDATTINQAFWAVAKDAGNIGKVEFFSGVMKASAGASGTMSWAGLMTQKKACGNFEVRADLPDFTAGDGNEAIARLSVEKAASDTPDFSTDALVIEIFKKNTGYAIKTIHYVNDSPIDQAETDYPYNSTGLMIQRTGKDFSTFYNRNGIWTLLKQFPNTHDADSFLFIGVKSSINNPPVSAVFDNFIIRLFGGNPVSPTNILSPSPTNILNPTNTPSVPTVTIKPTTPANSSPMPTPTLLACLQTSGNSYGEIASIRPYPAGDPPPENHPDFNLSIRGYILSNKEKYPIDLSAGQIGVKTPQLWKIIDPKPQIINVYNVFDWDWATNRRGQIQPIASNPAASVQQVQMIGLQTTQGQPVKVPPVYGNPISPQYNAMIIAATENSITMKYALQDDIGIDINGSGGGYAVQVEGVCIDPNLLQKYNQLHSAGRSSLPALANEQVFGTANSTEIRVVIRDTGEFLDPRSKLNWWQGY